MTVDHREAAGRCALPDPEPDILFILRIERLKGYVWILGELIQEEPLPVLGILLPGEAPFELLPLLPLPSKAKRIFRNRPVPLITFPTFGFCKSSFSSLLKSLSLKPNSFHDFVNALV